MRLAAPAGSEMRRATVGAAMAFVALFWLLPALVAAAASAFGHVTRRNDRTWFQPALAFFVAVAMIALGAIAAGARDPEVSDGDFATGVALAAVGLGAVPLLAFYSLGYALRYAWAVAMLWVVGSIALGFYMLLGTLFVAGLVACPPDAYECPV